LRRYFVFYKKKCRIYAAFGVSQTPKIHKKFERRFLDMATAEERLAKIKEKQAQLKAQEKKIITQEKAKERKLRTKRLIEIGGTAESILGRPFQDDDLQKFANFLKQQEARGNYYSKAMNNTNTQ
jgi:hypothetical protein